MRIKKREKIKDKSKKIYNLLYDLAKPKEEVHDVEEVEVEEDSDELQQPKTHYIQEEENTTDYFKGNYKAKDIRPSEPEPEPEQQFEEPNYQQEYEAKIDQIGGFIRLPSRRDRLNFKNFNI